MPYPTGAKVTALLATAGIAPPQDDDLTDRVRSAARAWERETGWSPFLAKQAVDAYDAPGASATIYGVGGGGTVLRLRKGLLSLNGISDATSGHAYVLGRDLSLMPAAEGWPTESLRFRVPLYGQPGALRIDAVWGFCVEESDDLLVASRAIVRMAAAEYAADAVQGRFASGVTSVKADDESVTVSPEMLGRNGEAWAEQAARAVDRYRRTSAWA